MPGILQKTLAAWWRELFSLAVLNALWLVLQFPIITAMPATAAFYVVAANVAAGDPVYFSDFWKAFRVYFWKATRWGVLQILVYFIGIFNMVYYAPAIGIGWEIIRIIWGTGLILWTTIQLLYWPLLLEAEDQRIRNTLRNALVMFASNPLLISGLAIITALTVFISILFALPAGLLMMGPVTLLGTFTVYTCLPTRRQTS